MNNGIAIGLALIAGAALAAASRYLAPQDTAGTEELGIVAASAETSEAGAGDPAIVAAVLPVAATGATEPASGGAGASTPKQAVSFGVKGDGRTDDTAALQKAIDAAAGGTLQLADGSTILVSDKVTIHKTIALSGHATIKVSEDIESKIGAAPDQAVLVVQDSAPGTHIDDLTVDLSGRARNAINVDAADAVVRNVSIKNYHKNIKSDGHRYGTSESGLRLTADRIHAEGIDCRDMKTDAADSVPRCISVQGHAADVVIRKVSGTNINGGVTVGASKNLLIDGYSFKGLTDNGLYLLGEAATLTAQNGKLEDTEEPVVFKSTGSTVRGLEIVNQGLPIGIENAKDVLLQDVHVRFTPGQRRNPAFIRTRRGNVESSNVTLRNVNAVMLQGDSVLSLGYGRLDKLNVEGCVFEMHWQPSAQLPPRKVLVRQSAGDTATYTNNTFKVVVDAGALSANRFRFDLPSAGAGARSSILAGNKFDLPGGTSALDVRGGS